MIDEIAASEISDQYNGAFAKVTANKVPITFGGACAVSDDMLYVASFPDAMGEDDDFTRLFVLNLKMPARWGHHDIADGTVNGVAFRPATPTRPRACLALTADGMVETYNSSQHTLEQIDPSASETTQGVFRAIRHIGDTTFACGAGNRVYKRSVSTGGWQRISAEIEKLAQSSLQAALKEIGSATQGAREPDLQAMTDSLRQYTLLDDIAGSQASDVYACGTNGVIMHWDGVNWTSLSSGTRQHLHAIHSLSDAEILICGHHGTVIRGSRKAGFKRIPVGDVSENLWAVRSYKGTIYVGTGTGLLTVEDSGLKPVQLPVDVPCQYAVAALDIADDVLWVVADKFVLRLIGKDWEFIEHPDNI